MAIQILISPTPALSTSLNQLLQYAAVKFCQSVSWDTVLSEKHQTPRLLRIDTRHACPLTYRSFLGLTLAQSVDETPRRIAEAIEQGVTAMASSRLTACSDDLKQHHLEQHQDIPEETSFQASLELLLPHISLAQGDDTQGRQWINIHIAAAGVAQWLDRVASTHPSKRPLPETLSDAADVGCPDVGRPDVGRPDDSSLSFSILHAHARCCTILRLAQSYGLIDQWASREDPPRLLSGDSGGGADQTATNIPWLKGDRLWLLDQARQGLLLSLVRSLDRASDIELAYRLGIRGAGDLHKAYTQGAGDVSRAFGIFHGVSRPLVRAAPAPVDQDISIGADLGIVWVAQRVLARFLWGLGITPPTRL